MNPLTGEEIHKSKNIAINYLTGKFFVDLISTLPFDLIGKHLVQDTKKEETKNFVLFSCMKLIRILRLSRIIDYMKSSESIKLQLKLVKLIFFLLLYIHMTGCAWIFICTMTNDFDGKNQYYHGC